MKLTRTFWLVVALIFAFRWVTFGDVIDDLIIKNNDIGNAILRHQSTLLPTDNLLISPPSLMTTLGMIGAGSSGKSRTEFLRSMGLSRRKNSEIGRGFSLIHSILTDASLKDVTLSLANSIWVHNQRSINSDYAKYAIEYFDTSVESIDFKSNSALPTIQKWISKKTKGAITEFPNSVDPASSILILNTLRFKGKWATPFNPKRSDDRYFIHPDLPPKLIPFMVQTGTFDYAATPTTQAIILPYGDGRFELLIVLPLHWDPNNLPLEWTTDTSPVSFEEHRVTVIMPKFKIQTQRSLKSDLSTNGFSYLFPPVSSLNEIASGAFLTDIVQKTVIEVSEEGTQAAAATGGTISITSIKKLDAASILLNRPFLYVIRDSISGINVFMGTYLYPSESE